VTIPVETGAWFGPGGAGEQQYRLEDAIPVTATFKSGPRIEAHLALNVPSDLFSRAWFRLDQWLLDQWRRER
jgi:hypothetical protein